MDTLPCAKIIGRSETDQRARPGYAKGRARVSPPGYRHGAFEEFEQRLEHPIILIPMRNPMPIPRIVKKRCEAPGVSKRACSTRACEQGTTGSASPCTARIGKPSGREAWRGTVGGHRLLPVQSRLDLVPESLDENETVTCLRDRVREGSHEEEAIPVGRHVHERLPRRVGELTVRITGTTSGAPRRPGPVSSSG